LPEGDVLVLGLADGDIVSDELGGALGDRKGNSLGSGAGSVLRLGGTDIEGDELSVLGPIDIDTDGNTLTLELGPALGDSL
jgi:hypothetical protein